MSAAVPVLTALLLTAFAGILLQRYSPAFALLLSLGAAVWLLLRLAQPLRGVLQAMAQLGQRTNAQAFSCLLRSADGGDFVVVSMGRADIEHVTAKNRCKPVF